MEQQQEEAVKGYTLQEFRDNPELLKSYRDKDPVPCICGACGNLHLKHKNSVRVSLKNKSQDNIYCTNVCFRQQKNKNRVVVTASVAYTLQEFRADVTLLAPYLHNDSVLYICGSCGLSQTKTKKVIVQAILKEKQEHLFCTKQCAAKLKNNYTERVCEDCGELVPREKLQKKKGWRCNSCHSKKPENKYSSYRSGAQKRNLPFNLSFDEFMVYWKLPCYYCEVGVDTIGLDRVDNLKGYTISNVVSCCGDCNWMKADSTQQQFLARCKAVAERHGPKPPSEEEQKNR